MNDENPIEEIWRIREELSAGEDYDVSRLFDRLREEQERYTDRLVRAISHPRRAVAESALVREEPPS